MLERDSVPPELVTEYLDRLEDHRREIEGCLAALPGAGEAPLRRVAHQLRGTGAIFGFPALTQVAGEVEDAPAGTLAAEARRLAELLAGITASSGSRILVVEDDPSIVRLLEVALKGSERRIRAAATAAEADALLARERFDLVVLDLFLPDDDGRRLLLRWRATPSTATLPVFVLSARLGAEVKAECYAIGADGYFEKPFDVSVVVAAVEGRLKRDRAAPSAAPPAAVPAAPAGPARIYLAEDDPLIAKIVTHRLGKGGHVLTHVGDGAAVLERVAAARPDLLILDIKMPEVDGLEVLRRLRADPGTRTLPVILLSALGEEEDVVRGFGLGADDYLVKPFSPTELAVRVDRLLRR